MDANAGTQQLAVKPPWRLLIALVAASVIVAIALPMCLALVTERELRELERRLAQERIETWIEEQFQELRAGRQDQVDFYGTIETDLLLQRLDGMPEVRGLSFEASDLTAECGMPVIASLPNLRDLTFYRCLYVTDDALRALAGQRTIERLVLRNARVTSAGLRALQDIPNLNHLKLSYKTANSPELPDVSLAALIPCSQLKVLDLRGEWANEKSVAEFKRARPDCRIVADIEARRLR